MKMKKRLMMGISYEMVLGKYNGELINININYCGYQFSPFTRRGIYLNQTF